MEKVGKNCYVLLCDISMYIGHLLVREKSGPSEHGTLPKEA